MENILKILGDINRLRIINLLMNEKQCVCEIEESLQLQQTSVSRHLAKLKMINILSSERKAQWIYYSISKAFVKENDYLIRYLQDIFSNEQIYKEDLARFRRIKERCTTGSCCT